MLSSRNTENQPINTPSHHSTKQPSKGNEPAPTAIRKKPALQDITNASAVKKLEIPLEVFPKFMNGKALS